MNIADIFPRFALLCAALILSGCAATAPISVSTRDGALSQPSAVAPAGQSWQLAELVIDVPRTLTVSEANTIKPRADIVWREDPMGDRYQQVEVILRDALQPVLANMPGSVPARIDLSVTRFHALTQRTRYSFGGEHEIEFIVTVSHAETGAILAGPRAVDLTFDAYGGDRAVAAEAQGITQRVRITERLRAWAIAEFPGASFGGVSSS